MKALGYLETRQIKMSCCGLMMPVVCCCLVRMCGESHGPTMKPAKEENAAYCFNQTAGIENVHVMTCVTWDITRVMWCCSVVLNPPVCALVRKEGWRFRTGRGIMEFPLVPKPSWPWALQPKAYTKPVEGTNARVWCLGGTWGKKSWSGWLN